MVAVIVTVSNVVAVLVAYRTVFRKVTGPDSKSGVTNEAVRVPDVRARIQSIYVVQVVTADGVPIKVALNAQYSLTGVVRAARGVEDFGSAVNVCVQIALRSVAASMKAHEVLEQRHVIEAAVLERAQGQLAEFGIALQSVHGSDVILPNELRQRFAQLAQARQAGAAGQRVCSGNAARRPRTLERAYGDL